MQMRKILNIIENHGFEIENNPVMDEEFVTRTANNATRIALDQSLSYILEALKIADNDARLDAADFSNDPWVEEQVFSVMKLFVEKMIQQHHSEK